MKNRDEIIRSVIGDNNKIQTCEGYAIEVDGKYEDISKGQAEMIEHKLKEAEEEIIDDTLEKINTCKAIAKVEEEQIKQNKFIDESIQKLNTILYKLLGSNLDDSEKVVIMTLVSRQTQQMNAVRVEYLMKSNAELKELYLQ